MPDGRHAGAVQGPAGLDGTVALSIADLLASDLGNLSYSITQPPKPKASCDGECHCALYACVVTDNNAAAVSRKKILDETTIHRIGVPFNNYNFKSKIHSTPSPALTSVPQNLMERVGRVLSSDPAARECSIPQPNRSAAPAGNATVQSQAIHRTTAGKVDQGRDEQAH